MPLGSQKVILSGSMSYRIYSFYANQALVDTLSCSVQ